VRNVRTRSLVQVLCLSATVALMATGCGEDTKKLETRVAELESENTQLKTEVESLKKSLAEAKPAVTTADSTSAGSGNTEPASTVTPTAVAATKFIDIEELQTKDLINDLCALGVFEGMGDKLEPNKPITRGEYVTWLYRANNALLPKENQIRLVPQVTQQYKDTPPTHPCYKYVQALSNAGYSLGYQDGTFRPDKPLTREEMMGIKVGLDGGKAVEPYRGQMQYVWKFSDGDQIDERFTGYIHKDYYVSGPNGSNIARAFGKIGTFRPKQPVLRSEAASTLWQVGTDGIGAGTAKWALEMRAREAKASQS
jgi:hypothetical protein